MTPLSGQAAIVTGGTAGIGAAVVDLFVRQGANVVVVARRTEPGESLVSRIGADRVHFVAGDVGAEETAEAAVSAATSFFGRPPDILVNNAAIDFVCPLLETTADDLLRVLRPNFIGAFVMLREAARVMQEKGGSIVNVVSRNASVGVASMSAYSGAKGALLSVTRAAAIELAPFGIRVNAVAPGLTDTPLIRAWIDEQADPKGFEQGLVETIPQGRLAEAREVAAAIAFLASPAASHLTGALIPVDGGYTAA